MSVPEYERNAVCLVSGGVDSVTTTYYVKTFMKPAKQLLIFCNYGQRTYPYEEFCIRKISQLLSVPLKIVDLRWLGEISTSVLTHPEKMIPETKPEDLWDPEKARQRILRWWDPCRNAILLLVALAHAESFYISRAERYDVYIGIRRETPVTMKDNCVAGDSRVYVILNGWLRQAKIADLVDPFFLPGEEGFKDISHQEVMTFSATSDGRIAPSRISHVYREKPEHKLYELILSRPSTRVAYSSKVTVTENHNVYAVDDFGNFLTKSSSELQVGDIIVSVKRLPYLGSRSGLSEAFLRFLGLWLGDGSKPHVPEKGETTGPRVLLAVGNDPESIRVVEEVCQDFKNFYGASPRPILRWNGVDIEINCKALVMKMLELGLDGYCEERKLPDWVYNLTEEELSHILWGWLESDGGYTVSPELMYGGKFLFLRTGKNVAVSIVKDNHYPGCEPRQLYRLMFNYNDKLVFLPLELRRKLVKELENYSWWRKKFGSNYWRHVTYFRRPNLKRWLEHVPAELSSRVSPWMSMDVEFLVLRELRPVDADFGYVYDLTVPEYHNFVANDIVIHNTPEFLEEMNRVSERATHHGGYRILSPLITYDKDRVVKLGEELGVPWIYTFSCYAGQGFQEIDGETYPIHCGICSNCRRRILAFRESGVRDPSIYAR